MSDLSPSDLPVLRDANASYVTPRLLVGGDLDVQDRAVASNQLLELLEAGVTHVVDCRLEADDTAMVAELAPELHYRWAGIDDAGQRVPSTWFDDAVGHVLEALADPEAVVLMHCHMGINRGPSLGYAVLLAQGWDPVDALAAIRDARPVAYVAYAEDALRWHHERHDVASRTQSEDHRRLRQWREGHPLDLVRIIAERRAAGY
ncbi:MAG: dual specificity protein phosphatase family protein [Nocardioides sp.]|nr:dual specificity protein phosphatase family protein [Nocardioides sp.]